MLSEERRGEAFELGEQLTVIGSKLKPGDMAPDFELDYFDPIQEEMKLVRLSDSVVNIRILNVINSLDTPVCHLETHRFEDSRSELPPEVRIYTISMDLPFAQARWHQPLPPGPPPPPQPPGLMPPPPLPPPAARTMALPPPLCANAGAAITASIAATSVAINNIESTRRMRYLLSPATPSRLLLM